MANRVFLFLLLLGVAAPSFAQTAAVASARREKTPLQFSFGPFTAVAPYNNANYYSTVADAQIQPAQTVSDNNTFASTSNFSTIKKDDSATTFATASNVGTVTTGSVSGADFIIGSTGTTCTIAQCFIEAEVNQNGNYTVGIGLMSTTLQINSEFDENGNTAVVHVFTGGTHTTFASVGWTHPSAPWSMGFSLMGSRVGVWQNTGSGWTQLTSADISGTYDPRVSGNLAGLQTAIKTFGFTPVTWQFSNLKTSLFGGLGTRDISVVTYPDGRPYMQGSVGYFMASLGEAGNSGYTDSGNGIFSYDVVSGTLKMIGSLGVTRSGSIYGDSAGQILYDPKSGTERLLVGTWATDAFGHTVYTSQTIGTDDWLAPGPHITPSAATVTLSSVTNPYDANMACTQYNYSTGACSSWLLATSSNAADVQALFSSTADPSANTWTSVSSASNAGYEGTRVLRTATASGGKGVTYWGSFVGVSSAEQRFAPIESAAGTNLGNLAAPLPAGAANAPHPTIFPYGNSEYFVTFSDAVSSISQYSVGNWVVAKAPRYTGAVNYPTFVDEDSQFEGGGSSFSTVTSKSFTATAGDLFVLMFRGTNTSTATVTFTSSPSNTITTASLHPWTGSGGGTGLNEMGYAFVSTSGSITFTATASSSQPYIGMTVEQFHPGFLTGIDGSVIYSGITSSTAPDYTSSTFSTTAPGLIIACPDGLFGGGTLVPGTIGPYVAAFGAGFSTGSAGCEGTVTPSAQTNITATMSYSTRTPGNWGGAIIAFK